MVRPDRSCPARSRPGCQVSPWERAEAAGLVRIRFEPETESYFDVYGRSDSPGDDIETERQIERQGLWWACAEYRDQETGSWAQADSIGMLFGDDCDERTDPSGYLAELKNSALANIYGAES